MVTLLLVYKCENGLAPEYLILLHSGYLHSERSSMVSGWSKTLLGKMEYLSSLLVPYVPERYGLRSNDLDLLSVPSADLKSYGHRAFSFGAVVEWN